MNFRNLLNNGKIEQIEREEVDFDKDLIDYFDNVRKRRNSFVYGIVEGASKEYAEYTLHLAENFVQKMRTFVQKMRTGVKNE